MYFMLEIYSICPVARRSLTLAAPRKWHLTVVRLPLHGHQKDFSSDLA